jgi:hypothetical protein
VTHRMETHEKGLANCQADGCSLPSSVLPWAVEVCGVMFGLWLCHAHGRLLERVSDSLATCDEEAA